MFWMRNKENSFPIKLTLVYGGLGGWLADLSDEIHGAEVLSKPTLLALLA